MIYFTMCNDQKYNLAHQISADKTDRYMKKNLKRKHERADFLLITDILHMSLRR
jgi:hypothetical protein